MKRLGPVIGVVLLIVALVYVNRGINRVAQPDNEDAPPPKTAPAKTPPPAPPGPPDPTALALIPETTVGDPAKAQVRVTVGWAYDEATQAAPQTLVDALRVIGEMAQNSGGRVSAEIVDLDVPAEEMSPAAQSVTGLGVSVDGKPVGPAVNPGEIGLTPPVIATAIQKARSSVPSAPKPGA